MGVDGGRAGAPVRFNRGALRSSVALLAADVVDLFGSKIAPGEPLAALKPPDEYMDGSRPHVQTLILGLVFCAGTQRTDWWEVGRIDRSVQDTEYRYIVNYRLTSSITQESVN
jgi:hypothetical protein